MAKKVSKTFVEAVTEFLQVQSVEAEMLQGKEPLTPQFKEGALQFARYLDSFRSMTQELEIIVLYKNIEVQREFISLLTDALGMEKATECARKLTEMHRHTKVPKPDKDQQAIPFQEPKNESNAQ
jgi:hypothetical protein